MSLPEIPRILWNFWINFADDKTEISEIDESVEVNEDDPPSNNIDKLPDYVQPYVRLMRTVHSDWSNRLITNKVELLYWLKKILIDETDKQSLIENINFVIKIINHSLINSAHKSDVVRYFLLKYYGGVWADATIIIFNPLDDLISGKQLVLPYMAISRAMKLIFGNPKSKIYKKNSEESIMLKDIDYDNLSYKNHTGKHFIMPENYFIASIPDHYIINNVLDQLKKLWNTVIPLIDNDNDKLIRLLTKDMQDMVYGTDKIFTDPTYDWLPIDDAKNKDIWYNPEKGVQPAYYLFNYIQLYNAIISDCTDETIIAEEVNLNKLEEIKEFTDLKKMYKDACNTGWEKQNVCGNITLSCKKGDIYLFSAEYLRLFKNPNKATNDENQKTFYDIMVNDKFKNNVLGFKQFLKDYKIYMYKVGGIQIKKSPRLMNKLFEYYNKCYDIDGKYTCKTRDLVKKHEEFIHDAQIEGGRPQLKKRHRRKTKKSGKKTHKRRAAKKRMTKKKSGRRKTKRMH